MFFYENRDHLVFKPLEAEITLDNEKGLKLFIVQFKEEIEFRLCIESREFFIAFARARFATFKTRIVCFYITSVIVMSNYRNQGYGTLLMREVMKWLTEQNKTLNLDLAMLHITSDMRKEKIRFYARNGFVVPDYQESHDITALFYSFNHIGAQFIEKMNYCNCDYDKGYRETLTMIKNVAQTWSRKILIKFLTNKINEINPYSEDGLPNYEGGKCEALMEYTSRNIPEIDIEELLQRKNYHYYIKS